MVIVRGIIMKSLNLDETLKLRDDMLMKYQAEHMIQRTPEKTWSDAQLYRCDLYDTRYPVCGTRLVWVVVGRKWVRFCTPIQHDKWRIRRDDWDKIPHELFVKKEIDDA